MIAFETPYNKIIDILGGVDEVGMEVRSVIEIDELVKRGLKETSVSLVAGQLGISAEELAKCLNVDYEPANASPKVETLNPNFSERLIKLAEIIYRGKEVLGSEELLQQWMKAKIPALDNKRPLDYLATFTGQEYLLTILGRIEHGIFS